MRAAKASRRSLAIAGILSGLVLTALVALGRDGTRRSELAFANKNDVLANNFVWEAPYPGAGPETPAWEKTPASVGQGADSALDDKNREHNVLAGEYQFPDYARRPAARSSKLWMKTAAGHWGIQQQPRTGLWVGSPSKMLPPDGDYPGGSTGIPEDGYLAYETGWGEQPYHGMTAPMQEAGIMQKVFVPVQLMGSKRGQTLSIMDPGEQPEPFNDWELGNSRADLDTSFDANKWWDLTRQPIDKYNMGKFPCTFGKDCHDNTHQGGAHDNGNQYYSTYSRAGTPNMIHDEYAAKKHRTPQLALPHKTSKSHYTPSKASKKFAHMF